MLRLVTLCLVLLNYGSVIVSCMDINGWFPCTLTEVPTEAFLSDVSFECATVVAPMCHSGICKNSSKSIEIFIKRKLAVETTESQDLQPRKSVWFLAGGPGASSADMEMAMLVIYAMSESSVDVYTVDHRGTGRSSFLECVAAQVNAGGSPGGVDILLQELPYCVEDVLYQLDGHTEAFSVTSAARDIVFLLDGLENDRDSSGVGEVYLYGTSYGTYLVERVMHLAPSQVKGYILDGVVSDAGPDPSTRLFFSHWDRNILAPTRRFFELCAEQQTTCPLQWEINKDRDILDVVLDIYDEIDEMENVCALDLMLLTGIDTPSQALRPLFGLLVRDPSVRELVPSILGRMRRCSSKDQEELELILGPLLELILQRATGSALPATFGPKLSLELPLGSRLDTSQTGSIAQLEYLLISYSELWRKPSPTEAELEEFYMDGIFSLGSAKLAQYCFLSGNLDPNLLPSEKDPACSQFSFNGTSMSEVAKGFTYALDEFSNQTAPVPLNSSLLVINGGLDFQTPWEFGRYQFESTSLSDPETSQKMLVEFDFGAHVCGLAATTPDDDTMCGPTIVTSFILNGGDPEAVDTSCMADLPEFQLTDNTFAMLVETIIEMERDDDFGIEK